MVGLKGQVKELEKELGRYKDKVARQLATISGYVDEQKVYRQEAEALKQAAGAQIAYFILSAGGGSLPADGGSVTQLISRKEIKRILRDYECSAQHTDSGDYLFTAKRKCKEGEDHGGEGKGQQREVC